MSTVKSHQTYQSIPPWSGNDHHNTKTKESPSVCISRTNFHTSRRDPSYSPPSSSLVSLPPYRTNQWNFLSWVNQSRTHWWMLRAPTRNHGCCRSRWVSSLWFHTMQSIHPCWRMWWDGYPSSGRPWSHPSSTTSMNPICEWQGIPHTHHSQSRIGCWLQSS